MTKHELAKKIHDMQRGETFDFEFVNKYGDLIYAAATHFRFHDLERVLVSAYGRNEYDLLITEFDNVKDIEEKLDFIVS